MFFLKLILSTLIILININSISKAETLTFPTNLVANTTDFVLLSTSGTTPSISGYSGNLLVTIVASAGNVKITNIASVFQAKGYCAHTADNNSAPTGCDDSNRTEIGFRGTQDNINISLATVSYKGDGTTGSPTLTVSITPAGTNYLSDTGHYYELVSCGGSCGGWEAARDLAAAKTYKGLTGYLATITSAAENSFLLSKISTNTWIGGSDDATYTSNNHPAIGTGDDEGQANGGIAGEGTWEWVTGPDNGKTFFCQVAILKAGEEEGGINRADPAHEDCTVASGYSYENWDGGEPNDHNNQVDGQENCAHLKSGGKWNDLPCDNGVTHYLVEYGGMPGESASTTGVVNLTIESIEASGSTYNIFDDKELVGVVDAQNESAVRFARNSMDIVLDRIHEFRLRKNNKSFNDNISLQVNLNDISKNYEDIVNHFASMGITQLANLVQTKKRTDTVTDDWQYWFNGKISSGRTGLRINNLGKNNEMDSITIGFDKLENNTLYGIAFNLSDDLTDISNFGSNLKMRAENLILYSTLNKKSFYLDTILGYGALKSLTERVVDLSNTSNKVFGDRKSEQFYGTTYLNHIRNLNNIDLQFFAGLDYIYTDFNGYSESGNDQKIKFRPHSLTNYTSSIGSKVFYKKENDKDNFLIFYKVEYKQDHSESTDIQGSLISDSSNTIYTYNYSVPYNYFMKLETGFNFKTNYDLNIYSKVGRIQKSNDDFQNFITIEFSQPF